MRRSLMRCAVAAVAAVWLSGTTGCGGNGLPHEVTPGQRADLHTLVGQARTAAGAGDLAATSAALARLKARVRMLRASGALEGAHAAELLKYAALAELKAQVTIRAQARPAPAVTPPPASPPAVTPPPVATPPPGKVKKPKASPDGKGAGKGG